MIRNIRGGKTPLFTASFDNEKSSKVRVRTIAKKKVTDNDAFGANSLYGTVTDNSDLKSSISIK